MSDILHDATNSVLLHLGFSNKLQNAVSIGFVTVGSPLESFDSQDTPQLDADHYAISRLEVSSFVFFPIVIGNLELMLAYW